MPADGPELWSSVRFHDYSSGSKDQMAMALSASCPLHPRATLCWREVAAEAAPCHDVPNSTASEEEQVRGPSLACRGAVPWCGHPQDPSAGWGQSVTLPLPLQVYTLDKVDVHPLLCFRVSPRGWQCLGRHRGGRGRWHS